MKTKRIARASNLSSRITESVGKLASFESTGRLSAQLGEITLRSTGSALKGDWERLGGDMRHAVDKVIPHVKTSK